MFIKLYFLHLFFLFIFSQYIDYVNIDEMKDGTKQNIKKKNDELE